MDSRAIFMNKSFYSGSMSCDRSLYRMKMQPTEEKHIQACRAPLEVSDLEVYGAVGA